VSALILKALLAAPDHRRQVVPAGELRLESIREVELAGHDHVTAYAIWGLGFSPDIILARGDHLVAELSFPSQEAMGAALTSPEAQAATGDVPNFATGGVTMFVAYD